MYSFDSRIRYSEVDSSAVLTIESLIDYFQDCSTFQTQDGPATMEYLREKGIAWVLNSWQIEIKRLPKLCEEVTIGTIPYTLKGPMGLRNFFMKTRDGEMLAVANSVWTLFDFVKGVPTRVTPEIIDAYPIEDKMEMDYKDRKIAIPEGNSRVAEEIVVRKHHLDTNNHVNNGQYIRMAMESLSDKDKNIVSLRAEYKKQALLGDVLYPVVVKSIMGDNIIYTVSLNDKNEESVCVVQFETN
ncbi:acyl-[acyl-carrier-protein] thioesterase [Butyrivibrio sp. VCB2006]|uniref:acyl-[acyl-carrier-protein] thioesterase n=1 Tax=Butyrivibrio sp. VCB2006 TaxID=1280679 RepID=UPI00041B7B52|nr:acyl-ACP thioesterase domain-containing protein [Butyrivibrio sp. VCB2006]